MAAHLDEHFQAVADDKSQDVVGEGKSLVVHLNGHCQEEGAVPVQDAVNQAAVVFDSPHQVLHAQMAVHIQKDEEGHMSSGVETDSAPDSAAGDRTPFPSRLDELRVVLFVVGLDSSSGKGFSFLGLLVVEILWTPSLDFDSALDSYDDGDFLVLCLDEREVDFSHLPILNFCSSAMEILPGLLDSSLLARGFSSEREALWVFHQLEIGENDQSSGLLSYNILGTHPLWIKGGQRLTFFPSIVVVRAAAEGTGHLWWCVIFEIWFTTGWTTTSAFALRSLS